MYTCLGLKFKSLSYVTSSIAFYTIKRTLIQKLSGPIPTYLIVLCFRVEFTFIPRQWQLIMPLATYPELEECIENRYELFKLGEMVLAAMIVFLWRKIPIWRDFEVYMLHESSFFSDNCEHHNLPMCPLGLVYSCWGRAGQ